MDPSLGARARPSRRGAGGAGSQRVQAKLRLALDKGLYYEAHQMYRTLYYRLLGQRQYAELETLLFTGSSTLLSRGQTGSGVDLFKLYLDLLQSVAEQPKSKATGDDASGGEPGQSAESCCQPDEDHFRKVATLYSLVPLDHADRESLLARAIKWSGLKGHSPQGHPRLHQMLAYHLWHSKRYPESRHHFLYSLDGSGCGSMLAEFHKTRGYSQEVDLFIAGTVLQYICLRKHIVAALALRAYTESHPAIKKGPPYAQPLLNFVWLLLLAIEGKQPFQAFSVLMEKYKASLTRDPAYLRYLDKIGQNFFGVPPPQRQAPAPANMFSGIFENMMRGLNDDDSDSDDNGGGGGPNLQSLLGPSLTSAGRRSAGASRSNKKSSHAPTMDTEDLD